MKFIKKHKKGIIVLVLVLLILGLLLAFLHTLMPDNKKSAWGSRINDIENHPITDEDINKVRDALTNHTSVNAVTHRLSGRTMNFIITVNSGVTREKSESLAEDIINNLSDDIKGYYDIELYYKSLDSEDSVYPFMGYKNKLSSKFSFTNAG